jgi:hypothetical protein
VQNFIPPPLLYFPFSLFNIEYIKEMEVLQLGAGGNLWRLFRAMV